MKKCIALLLALIMMFAGVMCAEGADLIFINSADEYYFDFLTKLGVLSVYQDESGMFDGTKEVTRAEAAMAIAGLINMGQGTDKEIGKTYIDVLGSEPASGSIAVLSGIQAMNGFGDNLFRPYETIQTTHFLKALMVALGYRWRAESGGGYPSGYLRVANDVKLFKDLKFENDKPLTRSLLLGLLYNALDVPVYEIVSVSENETRYEYNEDVTVLTQYHNIFKEKAVVYSDSDTSLNDSFQADEDSVLIGTKRVYIGDNKDIWNYLGCNVEYYYKQEKGDDRRTLLHFAPEKNTIITLTEGMITNVGNDFVEYRLSGAGKSSTLRYNVSTDVIYNGSRDAVNLKTVLNSLTGIAQFIDNNNDKIADVVIINDYTYGIISGIDLIGEKIYCDTGSIYLDDAESWIIKNEAGKILELSELVIGNALAISKSTDGELIRITVLSSQISGTVTQIGEDDIRVNDVDYIVSHGCKEDVLGQIKLNYKGSFILNQAGEIVFVKEATVDSLNIGYLIRSGIEKNGLKSKVFLKIMTTGGVDFYETKEKIKINDVTVEQENIVQTLKNLKNDLNLVSDGEISQVIRYQLDSNNLISKIYTARYEENDYLTLKYNSEGSEAYLREGYGVGTLDFKHFLGTASTCFQVPMENQEEMEDDYYSTFTFKDRMKDGEEYMVETYTIGDSIFPSLVIMYSADQAEIGEATKLFLVDSVKHALNSDGNYVCRFEGYVDGKRATYYAKDDVTADGLSRGDAVLLNLTSLNEIKAWEFVYDCDKNEIKNYEDIAGKSTPRAIKMYNVYRRENGFVEASINDFSDMDAALDNMYALDLSRATNICMYDSENDEIRVVDVNSIVDYQQDSTNYTRILIRFQRGFLRDHIIYK